MDSSNDPEINCVFCGIGFTSVENIESHIQLNHQQNSADHLESKKFLKFEERRLCQISGNKENDQKPSVNNGLKTKIIKQTEVNLRNCSMSNQIKYSVTDTIKVSNLELVSGLQTGHSLKIGNFKTIYKHKCCKCLKHFLFRSTLVIHLQSHHYEEQSKLKCDKCGSRFSTKQVFLRHSTKGCIFSFPHDLKPSKTLRSSLKSYYCEYCQTTFTSDTYLEIHQRRICKSAVHHILLSDTSNNLASQTIAKKYTRNSVRSQKSANDILKSEEIHPSVNNSAQKPQGSLNKKYFSFSSKRTLKDNILSMTLKIDQKKPEENRDHNFHLLDFSDKEFQKPFQCEICKKYFTNRSSLSNHIKSHYSSRGQPFICRDCNQRFVNLITLQDHRRQICSQKTSDFKSPVQEEPKFKPIYSLSNFNGVSQVPLWPPITTNTCTNQPVTCVHCNGVFYDRLELEEHALSKHSDEHGNILCLLCERTFSTNMALRVHLTKSHGFANGGCPGVSQNLPPMPRLDTSYNITNDIPHKKKRRRLFDYEKEFACEFCNRNFSTCQALGNHRRACINIPHDLISIDTSSNNFNQNSKLHSIESLIFDNKSGRSATVKDDKNVFLAFN